MLACPRVAEGDKMSSRWRSGRRRRSRVKEEEWASCPDCQSNDAVTFAFGFVKPKHLAQPGEASDDAIVSFVRRDHGVRRTSGCETCGGKGVLPVQLGRYAAFTPRKQYGE